MILFADMTKPLAVITHNVYDTICRYDQAIVIIRSPYDALIAEFHRKNQTGQYYESGHLEWADEALFYTEGRSTLLFAFFFVEHKFYGVLMPMYFVKSHQLYSSP